MVRFLSMFVASLMLALASMPVHAEPLESPIVLGDGFERLASALDGQMGSPLGPEIGTDDGSGTFVLTDTGLAYWGAPDSAAPHWPTWTDGDAHAALAPSGYVIRWHGADADPPAPAPVAVGAVPSLSGRVACIVRAESGGDPNATNRSSKAAGLGQFLWSTWLTTPQGKAGLSPYDAQANLAAIQYMLNAGRAREFEAVTRKGC